MRDLTRKNASQISNQSKNHLSNLVLRVSHIPSILGNDIFNHSEEIHATDWRVYHYTVLLAFILFDL